jgi:UDP-N-acetylmuramoyl-tripeptide--D-alanyl-D-alanine ligase
MKSLASFTWTELLEATGGELVAHHRHLDAVTIETDTRQFQDGAENLFFVPIVGKNFNAQDFLPEAYHAGIEGAFISKAYLDAHPDLSRFPNLIVVPDTTEAYLALGRYHRRRCGPTVVAITGSSGKTTTKEMLALMLSNIKTVQRSEKNHNNEIGVAQTLLNLKAETDVLVIEMGMRGLGQISLLTRYAEPDVALITNVGSSHIGLLGSQANIAKAKCEILEGLNPEAGIAILNGDDPLMLKAAAETWQGREEIFTLHDVDNIHRLDPSGLTFEYQELTFRLGVPGQHNIMNALACLKVAECLNISLKRLTKVLESYDGGDGRWEKTCLSQEQNVWAINDAYNANPESLRASMMSFLDCSRDPDVQKILVLGHMAELGDYEKPSYERFVDWLVAHQPETTLLFVGEKAQLFYETTRSTKLNASWVASIEDAVTWALAQAPRNVLFLLKGSREAQLDRFIPVYQEALAKTSHAVP